MFVLLTAVAAARVSPRPTGAAGAALDVSKLPPGPVLEECPPSSRAFASYNASTSCNETCQAGTRRALIEINKRLIQQPGGGIDWSNDPFGSTGATVNFTTGVW
ncbi:hypothetical protein MNEG_15144 [Monoraphidium neglectum]|uniref:Uncharacterized protein n=1 Tax=Monoraphidium neglectum TaxID=145388 RepID=A0A0D2K9T9_9CHLO|nr:hypothetical protein MNEG_15144 [Monoraphidium neglectum]KIY92818.1 hypothetical protein MNEG_15144 [Monoraphidium neglectum]|eukprot:XP_013891838.1 hypothetical protein MNEG_15144 [Monoraphidium neglectum]